MSIFTETLESGGGTFDIVTLDAAALPSGYVVALEGRGEIIPADLSQPSRDAFYAYFWDAQQQAAAAPSEWDTRYVGTWVHEGKIYLDIVEHYTDRAYAIGCGQVNNQIAIWDVANGCEIPTGGTGEVVAA